MSEGPIKQARIAWRPPVVSTTSQARVCMVDVLERRTVCGRKPERDHQTSNWDDVRCSECTAAARADGSTR